MRGTVKRFPVHFCHMNHNIWKNMEASAWKDANIYEKLFLSFCLAFDFVSGDMTASEHEFWNFTLDAEKKVRHLFLSDNSIKFTNDNNPPQSFSLGALMVCLPMKAKKL